MKRRLTPQGSDSGTRHVQFWSQDRREMYRIKSEFRRQAKKWLKQQVLYEDNSTWKGGVRQIAFKSNGGQSEKFSFATKK